MNITQLFSNEYKKIKIFWKSGYQHRVSQTAIAFLVLMLISFVVCLLFPTLHKQIVAKITAYFSSANIIDDAGNLSALGILKNNLGACAFTILYGLIPFAYLSALSLGTNAMILGVMGAYFVATQQNILTYFLGIVPHGIFELPAIVLSVSLGLYLCNQVNRRIRKDKSAMPVMECLNECSRMFLLVITPLLFLAALIETYVTPYLIN